MLRIDHLFLFGLIMFLVQKSRGSDTIIPGQSLSGNSTITSKGGVFEMGLFSPSFYSTKYYLGIWYKGHPMLERTVVWVANRKNPIFNLASASLEFGEDGNLVLFSPFGHAIWSTNMSHVRFGSNAAGVLGDDGNFMLRETSRTLAKKKKTSRTYGVSWQSFDHPTDTFLPGALLEVSSPRLTSWKDIDDPTPGIFYASYKPPGFYYGNPRYYYYYVSDALFTVYLDESEVPFIEVNCLSNLTAYTVSQNESSLFRIVLDVNGQLKLFVWRKGTQQWTWISCIPQYYSNSPYSFSEFSICDPKNACHCMEGFDVLVPKPHACERRTGLHCINGSTTDRFNVIPNIRYPLDPQVLQVKNSSDCRFACLADCSCSAYAYYYSQCFIWKDTLENIQELSSSAEIGGDLYVRVAASDELKGSGKKRATSIRVVISIVLPSLAVFLIMLIIMWRKLHGDSAVAMGDTLMLFKQRHLQKATKNFSHKLGEGGFSDVYKGELPNSTLVAVKQLKGYTHQDKQLRAEISTIGVIQHKNLLRLRGFCLGHSKRFLVYDYMPNGSLQSHLFKKGNTIILDWTKRYNIALGTAKGLAYLHDSCRDCIIHCDIKPDNILLDADFTPKLADFGLAKLLGRNFCQVLTTMRGTRGYLAPEWFSGGAITSKVDVYSYGQVLFEILSGRRNMDLSNDELSNYFPSLVLNALNNGEEVVTLADPKLQGDIDVEELTRACNVACWCIQDHENDRPTMAQVIQILEGTLLVGVPPIPQFFRSLAQGSLKISDINSSEICGTSSSMPYSFSFQPPVAVSISNSSDL